MSTAAAITPSPAVPAVPVAHPTVPRRHGLSREEFTRDFLNPRKPVVMVDVVSPWAALTRWTPESLRERFPDRQVVIKGVTYRFKDFIDQLLRADPANPAPYLNQEVISRSFPELVADLQPMPWCFRTWLPTDVIKHEVNLGAELELFIGAKGGGLHLLHYDYLHLHAFSVQIYGRKRFYLYPPEQTPYVYAQGNCSKVDNVLTPDLARFPLFAKAVPLVLDLAPGEVLFLPCGWWHDTRLLSDSISMSINTACASNWADVRRDICAHSSRKWRPLVWLWLLVQGWVRRLQGR